MFKKSSMLTPTSTLIQHTTPPTHSAASHPMLNLKFVCVMARTRSQVQCCAGVQW